jgi:hypothetical protein
MPFALLEGDAGLEVEGGGDGGGRGVMYRRRRGARVAPRKSTHGYSTPMEFCLGTSTLHNCTIKTRRKIVKVLRKVEQLFLYASKAI